MEIDNKGVARLAPKDATPTHKVGRRGRMERLKDMYDFEPTNYHAKDNDIPF